MEINSYLEYYGFISKTGLSKSWDFPSNGAELRINIRNLWWKCFVSSSPYNFGYDGMIITNSSVLKNSGHLDNFYDWIVICLECKRKFRVDNIISEEEMISFLNFEKKEDFFFDYHCFKCNGKFSSPEKIDLLVKTNIKKDTDNNVYLRPETCQSIFSNFFSAKRKKEQPLPFGIGQIGKSYRNEPTLNHGIFRMREFEQMELEFFCEEEELEIWWNHVVEEKSWLFISNLISCKEKIKKVFVNEDDLPHYSKRTLDFYFNYDFGWGEICSNSYRGDYDLSKHSLKNGMDFKIKSKNGNLIYPHVIEVSFGLERLFLAILEDSYREELIDKNEKKRAFLKINPIISPYFASILFVNSKLKKRAYSLYLDLLKIKNFNVSFEDSSSIGKGYRKQDCIGTYYCITVDFKTIEEDTVTCRNRNTMGQERVNISNLKSFLITNYFNFWNEFIANF